MMHAGNRGPRARRDSVAPPEGAGYTGFAAGPAREKGENAIMMSRGFGFAALVLALAVSGAAAAQGTAPASGASKSNAQQERMKECNARAADKKGDARKEFMSDCLSGKDTQQLNAQQQRMKDCNARATGKTGDDRKKFMSACLSG